MCVMLYGLVMCIGENDSSASRAGVSVLRCVGTLAGDAGVGWGLGSSGPMILGWRWNVAFLFVALFSTSSSFLGGAGVGGVFDDLERVVGLGRGEVNVAVGVVKGVGVGEASFRRALFAFLLRNLSSSSEVTSESLASKSILMATDSRLVQLLRELPPKEGARFTPVGKGVEPVNVSERRSFRGPVAMPSKNSSELLEIDEVVLFKMREGLGEMAEFRVVELGVDGRRDGAEIRG